MEKKDYYSILGLDRKATDNEIKLNYHKLVKLYHPDLKLGSNLYLDKFIKINEAYSILRNETSRRAYDLQLRELEENNDSNDVNVVYNGSTSTKSSGSTIINQAKKTSGEYLFYYKSAKKAYSKGEFVKALTDVNKAIEINKSYAKSYDLKGDILYKYQNYKDALKAYETYTKYCSTKELSLVKEKIQTCLQKKQKEKNLLNRIKRKLFN